MSMSEPNQNPFAAPKSDPSGGDNVPLPDQHGSMPASVVLATATVASIVALLALLVLMGGTTLGYGKMGIAELIILCAPLGVGVLLLIGLLCRNKLARQWGRIMGCLGAVLASIALGFGVVGVVFVAMSNEAAEFDAQLRGMPGGSFLLFALIGLAVYAVPAVMLWTIFFSLGRPAARRWFGLVCPSCHSPRTRAANFLYSRSKCKECSTTW